MEKLVSHYAKQLKFLYEYEFHKSKVVECLDALEKFYEEFKAKLPDELWKRQLCDEKKPVNDLIEKFKKVKEGKDYKLQVETTIKLLKEINNGKVDVKNRLNKRELTLDEGAGFSIVQNNGKSAIEDHITSISKSPEGLMQFAYELRKQDVNDEYSKELLEGHVQPISLYELLISNKWDEKDQVMKA